MATLCPFPDGRLVDVKKKRYHRVQNLKFACVQSETGMSQIQQTFSIFKKIGGYQQMWLALEANGKVFF